MDARHEWTEAEIAAAAEHVKSQDEFWHERHRPARPSDGLGFEPDGLGVLIFRMLARLHPEAGWGEITDLMVAVCNRMEADFARYRRLRKERGD